MAHKKLAEADPKFHCHPQSRVSAATLLFLSDCRIILELERWVSVSVCVSGCISLPMCVFRCLCVPLCVCACALVYRSACLPGCSCVCGSSSLTFPTCSEDIWSSEEGH